MTDSILKDLLAGGENSHVEFKRDTIRGEQLAREAVAFANSSGGTILLGVDDDKNIIGTTRINLQEWVFSVFQDHIVPHIVPSYEERTIAGKTIGILSIPAGLSKPYMMRHNGREDAFIRMGSASILASREQMLRLFEQGGLLSIEALPVASTSPGDLDFERVRYYCSEVLQYSDLPRSEHEEEWTSLLFDLGLLVFDARGEAACSVAALLCFGKQPYRHLRHAGIRLMVFDSRDKEYRARHDSRLEGPMVARFEQRPSGRWVIDDGLIERFMTTIMPFITEEADTVAETWRREQRVLYPREAVRELVLNALVHRDWSIPNEVEVTCYSNRIEIISPGGLKNSMTVRKMLAGQRSMRNPLLMDILKDYGYVEARGMGIRRTVVPQVREVTLQDPLFEASDDQLKVTIFAKSNAFPEST